MKLDPCDFCFNDLPETGQKGLTVDSRRYVFCSDHCRDQFKHMVMDDEERPILNLGLAV